MRITASNHGRLPYLLVPMQVMDDVQGFMRAQMIWAGVQLKLADSVGDGARPTAEIAAAAGCTSDPEQIFRLLRALEAFGYFTSEPVASAESASAFINTCLWRNNALSSVLRSDHPNSLSAMVAHLVQDGYRPWDRLADAVRTGQYVWPEEFGGQEIWSFYARGTARGEQFAKAMTAVDALGAKAQVDDYPWGSHKRLIDVGGSLGSMLARIMTAHPSIQSGVLFDLPNVCEQATGVWASQHAELVPKTQIVPGSFLVSGSIPSARDGDAYMLRNILHDWDDDKTTLILTNLRTAMGSVKATLVLLELAPSALGDVAALPRYTLDLHMMVMLNAKERSRSQWNELLATTGFRLVAIRPTRSLFQVVEAVPV